MLKYRELIYDLFQAGYSLYILDHRGQGFSGRILTNSQIGHVEHFDDYVTDLKTFVDHMVRPSQENLGAGRGPLFLLAHSMGGCIASLYLEKYPRDFQAAVLCSPMHQPSTGFIPEDLARMVAERKDIIGKEKCYALGKGPYLDTPYDGIRDPRDSALTHSKSRFEEVRALYNANPHVKVGGPSFQWVAEAIHAGKRARENSGLIEVPVLLLQAGDDAIVSPSGQEIFRANARDRCTMEKIPGAYHELFIESEVYRDLTVRYILDFLKNHTAPAHLRG
jgi:lysophospholipase